MTNLTEKETREKLINPRLERVGWKINSSYVKEEVNTVKSNFKTKEYIFRSSEIEKGVDKFLDYLLLAEDRSPLAIIEAKKTSIGIEKGKIQAESYRADIEKQIGIKIPIFLTNGTKWFYEDDLDRLREIKLPFTQKDLQRIVSLSKNRKSLSNTKINPKIVDRRRGVEAVRVTLEHIEKGHREALINMATGTGKTRVSMALIDSLRKANYVQKVLFVVDRITLGNQAKEKGFKKYFDDPVCSLNEEGYSDTARLYVSTVQTLMSDLNPRGKFYEKFGTGAFDLIIFDEAHRSYYDRNNDIFEYFDAIKIGLTATPRIDEEGPRNTFKLFNCEDGKPTYRYDYEDAVREGILAPYYAEIIETKVLFSGIEGNKLGKKLKQALAEQEINPEKTDLPGTKFERIFTDEKTNELIIREFLERCYKTDDGRPCKTIFFCASVRHAEEIERLFQKLYPNLSKDVKTIVSERARYTDEVKNFEKKDSPRIALSVGVLDTGIDIPEIMNLVFIKPVMSSIRFWQMLGRGTRHLSACENKKWLPMKEGQYYKDDFLILDFKFGEWSNVQMHGLKALKQKSPSLDAKTRIFLDVIDLIVKGLEKKEKEIISKQIIESVEGINIESPLVLEKKGIIQKVILSKFDLDKHIRELRDEIAPLLIYSPSMNSLIYSFISKCVDLFKYIKKEDRVKILEIRDYVIKRVESIWDKNLEVIKKKRDDLVRIQQEEFWDNLTFEEVDFLIREIAHLMIYYEDDSKLPFLRINAPDFILNVEKKKMEVKESKELSEFIYSNKFMIKLREGEGITSEELLKLEKDLRKLNNAWTIKNIQQSEDFILFLRGLLGIQDLPNPNEMIKWEFDKFISDRNEHYNSEQLKFLRLLEQVFVRTKYIELKDFAEHPLADARPLDLFTKEQLKVIVEKCNNLKWR